MYKMGDTITFTEEIFEAAKDHFRGSTKIFSSNFLRKYVGKKGVIVSKRIDRFMEQTIIKWEDGRETNTLISDHAGVGIERAEFQELSVFECPDGIISFRKKYNHKEEDICVIF